MLDTIRSSIVKKVASRHIAGEEQADALIICEWAQKHNIGCILSPWADMLSSWPEHRSRKSSMFDQFRSDIETISHESLDGYLSIKLDAIDYDLDILRDLLHLARRYKVRVHIDSLGPDSVNRTFRLLERLSEFHDQLGYTLPSRWHRSLLDAQLAIRMGLAIRVVKGQWKDPERTVDARKNYLAIINKLAGRVPYIGVATHDLDLAEQALNRISKTDTHAELEQFFSLPLNGRELAQQMGIPYRIYVAYGHPAIPYNYRFALTRPRLAAWMVSDYLFPLKRPWSS